MALRIVRNDITKMDVDAIINTANRYPCVSDGCDRAVYTAAGYERLIAERRKIGTVDEGNVFITPGFGLPARHIIHAVSPVYHDGKSGEKDKLRSCYRKSLKLAEGHGFSSVAFPLISTGSFGYPKEEGMRIAVDEINSFLTTCDMEVYLVIFDDESTRISTDFHLEIEAYIDSHYVAEAEYAEYCDLREIRERDERRNDSAQTHAASFAKAEFSGTLPPGASFAKSEISGTLPPGASFAKSEISGIQKIGVSFAMKERGREEKKNDTSDSAPKSDRSHASGSTADSPQSFGSKIREKIFGQKKVTNQNSYTAESSPNLAKTEREKSERINPECINSERIKTEGVKSERKNSERMVSECANSERINPKCDRSELISCERINTECANPELRETEEVADEMPQLEAFDENGDYNAEALRERMEHIADSFQQYLFYLISAKGMKNEDVWKKSIVDRKLFSKIKNDENYHPKKITALCLCVGLGLNLDETKDLLARAGYALSPCDKSDIIFSFFIENKVYDMIELSIALENHGLPCIIE